MAIIDFFKDRWGRIIYPKTVAQAIYDLESGERLDKYFDKEFYEKIGDPAFLETVDKSTLVSAINELKGKHDSHLAEKASDNVHGLKPESPISILLLNGWTNQSISVYGEASYYKDAFGLVHLQGTIKAPPGNRTLTIFNLPQGYRPSRRKHLLVANATQTSAGIMNITSDGDVNIESTTGDGNVISLNTVSFKAGE